MKISTLLLTFLILGISLNSIAAQEIKQNEGAPFTGVLFSLEEARDIKHQLVELDLTKEINVSLNKSIELYKLEITNDDKIKDIYKQQNKELMEVINTSKSLSDWQKVGYFSFGVVTTTVIVYAIKQIVK